MKKMEGTDLTYRHIKLTASKMGFLWTQFEHGMSRKTSLSKGTYIRPPYISKPEKVSFISKQSFLFDFFGQNKRPLTAIEITHLFLKYAEDGANILIKNGWLEEPPQADNRLALINQSK